MIYTLFTGQTNKEGIFILYPPSNPLRSFSCTWRSGKPLLSCKPTLFNPIPPSITSAGKSAYASFPMAKQKKTATTHMCCAVFFISPPEALTCFTYYFILSTFSLNFRSISFARSISPTNNSPRISEKKLYTSPRASDQAP